MNLQPKFLELLNKRGLHTEEEITEFLSAKPQKTYDPFLLLNMEAGVDFLLSSIENDEMICIYGDYDADGITSTAVLMEVLSHLTDRLTYYIPSRFEEGYGLNCKALDKIKAAGVDTVVTVDCGSVSCEEVDYAKKIGLKILVTDHHTVTDKIADCLVINPMQPGCTYPFKHLAGVGVAFKLAQAVAAETGLDRRIVNRTLDLVGIGTIGDIVPLVDENRTLAKYGIRAVNVSQRTGLEELIAGVGLHKGKIRSENISYIIVPHLNACGRMDDAKKAAKLMLEQGKDEAEKGVEYMMQCNSRRKQMQEDTFARCCQIVEEKYKDDLFLLIDLPDAHEGITGIVAGRLKETYYRPSIIVTPTGDGLLKGTGRGIEGINLYDLLKENETFFLRFGGHAAACGFTMKEEYLSELRANLNHAMAEICAQNSDILYSAVTADLELSAREITLELVESFDLLEPFGCDNPAPTVRVCVFPKNVRKMGNKGQYTRFTGVLDDGREISCVIFKGAEEYDTILSGGSRIAITGALKMQLWNEKKYLQMTVQSAEKQGDL